MKLEEKISNWLDEYITSNNLKSFVIGVSGGIDSAVTSTLCAMTGKPTIVLNMPIHQSELQLNRANNHLKWLKSKYPNIRVLEFDLTQLFETFKLLFTEEDNLALANTRSRLRMVTLYQVATMNKGIVVGTGNKVEDFGVGFYTKYGDGGVDISPIADCTKTQVWELGKYLGVDNKIIDAEPTDGLWNDSRTVVDQFQQQLRDLEKAMTNSNDPNYKKYLEIRKKNLHKMNPIPVCKFND